MNQTKPIANASYMPQLDALRAFAVAAVAYSHWVPREYTQTWGSGGVRLFFVLSGFLITGILLRCREHGDWKFAARAFYARRFLRIVPLFYAVLFAAFIFNIPSVRETLLWHVFYLSNFYFVWNQGWNGEVSHFWSLAVEEQFYLFWPAVILCLPARYIAPSAIGLIATGVVSRFFLPQVFPRGNWWIAFPTANFDSLGVGALLAIMAVGKFKDAVNRWLIASVPIYFILFAMRQIGFPLPLHGVWEDLGMLLSFAWLVSVASVGFPGWVKVLLEIPLLLYLGRISYGLYVLHNFAPRAAALVANVIGVPSLKHGLPNIIVMAAITIGGASLSWHFFESPLNKLKRNFPYKKRPDQVVNTGSPASLSLDG